MKTMENLVKGDRLRCLRGAGIDSEIPQDYVYFIKYTKGKDRIQVSRTPDCEEVYGNAFYFVYRFKPAIFSFEDLLAKAKKLVGKKIVYSFSDCGDSKTEYTTFECFSVATELSSKYSDLVNEEVKESGYCVYLHQKNNPYGCANVPVNICEEFLIPIVEFQLNDTYFANINPNRTVTVGCQTFPFEKIKELMKALLEMEEKIAESEK